MNKYIWTNGGLVYWHIYAYLWLDELNEQLNMRVLASFIYCIWEQHWHLYFTDITQLR